VKFKRQKSYKPKVSQAEAQELLTLRGKIFRSRKNVPYQLELIYLPYYFFKILVKNKKGETREFCGAIDAIVGSFSLVDCQLLEPEEISQIEFEPKLSMEEAKSALLKSARWFLYQRSLPIKERYQLVEAGEGELVFYPFWVGYYRNRAGALEFLGLDAITRVLQGGEGRKVFIFAFAESRFSSEKSKDN